MAEPAARTATYADILSAPPRLVAELLWPFDEPIDPNAQPNS